MGHRTARLATAVMLTLALRAACGQPPAGEAPASSPDQASSAALPGGWGATPVPAVFAAPGPQPPIPDSRLPTADSGPPNFASRPPPPDRFPPWEIIARVGDKVILYSDVAPMVQQIIGEARSKAKTPEELMQIDEQILAARDTLIRNLLRQIIEIKLKYLAFERDFHSKVEAKKRPEALKSTNRKVREHFEKGLAEARERIGTATPEEMQEFLQRDAILTRLALLMRDHHLESLGDLDNLLRRFGSSLEKQIQLYGEDQLGRSMVGRHVRFDPEVTHEEMLDYYYRHLADYAVPAKARFEILSVKFVNFRSREEALAAIVEMGNAVYLGGKPLEAVARQFSQEPHASRGGQYDWVTQGSLASEPIDRALFTIETNKLSQIVEDHVGFHIIRVHERRPAGQVPFSEAQDEIKKAIKLEKRMADYKKFVQELQARAEIWTIYDAPGAVVQGK